MRLRTVEAIKDPQTLAAVGIGIASGAVAAVSGAEGKAIAEVVATGVIAGRLLTQSVESYFRTLREDNTNPLRPLRLAVKSGLELVAAEELAVLGVTFAVTQDAGQALEAAKQASVVTVLSSSLLEVTGYMGNEVIQSSKSAIDRAV